MRALLLTPYSFYDWRFRSGEIIRYNADGGRKVSYTKVYEVDSMSKDQIFVKIKAWVVASYGSQKQRWKLKIRKPVILRIKETYQ